MNRRSFLQLIGVGTAAAATGISVQVAPAQPAGNALWAGDGAPLAGAGRDGDIYFCTGEKAAIYQKHSGLWRCVTGYSNVGIGYSNN